MGRTLYTVSVYKNGSSLVRSVCYTTMRLTKVYDSKARKYSFDWERMRTAKVVRCAKTGVVLWRYSINYAIGISIEPQGQDNA